MKRQLITSSGKIRERHIETPPESRHKLVGKVINPPQPPVVFKEVAGVQSRHYAALPNGLWNEVTTLLGATLRVAARTFNDAFKHGVEPHLQDLIQNFIPQLVYSLGTQLIQAVLNQERGFYGSRIHCPECGQMQPKTRLVSCPFSKH